MRLLVMVMGERQGELLAVRRDAETAAAIAEEVLGSEVIDVVSAADSDAENDYWITIPDDVVAAHTVAPNTMQAYKVETGLIAASTVVR